MYFIRYKIFNYDIQVEIVHYYITINEDYIKSIEICIISMWLDINNVYDYE